MVDLGNGMEYPFKVRFLRIAQYHPLHIGDLAYLRRERLLQGKLHLFLCQHHDASVLRCLLIHLQRDLHLCAHPVLALAEAEHIIRCHKDVVRHSAQLLFDLGSKIVAINHFMFVQKDSQTLFGKIPVKRLRFGLSVASAIGDKNIIDLHKQNSRFCSNLPFMIVLYPSCHALTSS